MEDIPWIALIAAVVGSSGLVGGLTLMVQHSRAARLRRSVRESLELSSAFGEGERPRHALHAAASLDAYRLAAMSLMQIGGRAMSMFIWLLIGLALALVVMGWGLASLVGDGATTFGLPMWILLIAYGLAYALALAFVLDQAIRRRRDRMVERLMSPGKFTVMVADGRSKIHSTTAQAGGFGFSRARSDSERSARLVSTVCPAVVSVAASSVADSIRCARMPVPSRSVVGSISATQATESEPRREGISSPIGEVRNHVNIDATTGLVRGATRERRGTLLGRHPVGGDAD